MISFDIPLVENRMYSLEFEWNAKSAEYTGSFFGTPFSQGFDVSPYSQGFTFFVEVKDTSSPSIQLLRSQAAVGVWGEVIFTFSRPVEWISSKLTAKAVFEK